MTASQPELLASAHSFASAGAGRLVAAGNGDLGAGFIAFVVVVALGVACYFLFRSMVRHLGKVPAKFEAPPPPASPATAPVPVKPDDR